MLYFIMQFDAFRREGLIIKTKITDFKIEYAKNPIGLDVRLPHYSWSFETEKMGVFQSEYRIIVKGFIDEILWDSGIVKSDKTFGIIHEGTPLSADTPYRAELYAKLGEEELYCSEEFRTGLLDEAVSEAKWICAEKDCSSPLFRKTFYTGKRIAYATLYVAARGFYEAYLNGKRIGNRILAPAILSDRSYTYECAADAYDVTDYLTLDNNTLGFWLGQGYSLNSFSPWGWVYEGEEKLWCALSIIYEDCDTALITSGEDWVWHQSPILENSIYGGETYDKNLEINDWCSPYLDTSSWGKCNLSDLPEGVNNIYTLPIIEKSVAPAREFILSKGDEETVCDFGVNSAGYVRIKLTGEPGTKIIIEHSENITPEGKLNTFTNRDAKATDTYILKGGEIEVYEPRFTYHCFRYAKIKIVGVAQLISAYKVTIGTDFEPCGDFGCDDKLLERMFQNAKRSLEANLLSYPSDCAVRDERTPCSMDSMAYEELVIRSFDAHRYYRHWLRNTKMRVGENGQNPTWNGDIIALPLLLLEYYGDEEIVEEMYPWMKLAIADSINTYNKTHFNHIYGDWCAPNPKNDFLDCYCSSPETGLCLLIWELEKMAELAKSFSEPTESKEFSALALHYRGELYDRFFDESECSFSGGKQTPNILSITYNAAKPEHEEGIYAALKNRIRKIDDCHFDTGIFGTRFIIELLSRDAEGREILYNLLHKTDYPSFGEQILKYDATTLFEQWSGLYGMMSCNHPMFGGIFADFSKIFAGIKNGGDCFKQIIIEPILPLGIKELRCSYKSIRGEIAVYMRYIGAKLHFDITIPPNCSAILKSPNGEIIPLENGKHML